jgi:acetyl-CoA C-acetyltransferase
VALSTIRPVPSPSSPSRLDPRTPVVIGVGQAVQRNAAVVDALDPVGLMEEAIREATADAKLAGVPTPDAIRVVSLLSWRYRDPARFIAEDLGFATGTGGVQTGYTTPGGSTPQSLLNLTAAEIQRGDLDLAILTGGECSRTKQRAKREDVTLTWRKLDDAVQPDRMLGSDLVMNHEAETSRGIYLPVQIYPMFESALRAHLGRSVDEHQVAISELWARFSAVAAQNPYSWAQRALTAEEIRTVGPDNRMIGYPYPKRMNSNNDVDMAASVIICSVERARQLGVPEDRWVFPLSGADCHETPFVSQRAEMHAAPAIGIGGRAALDLAGLGIDDIDVIDLYSCFPVAVQVGAQELGIGLDRQLTQTGGLPFHGGPWNNYVMHAIATVVQRVRERSSAGFVWANGGYLTKHAFGVYAATPPADGFRHARPQDEIDALPSRSLADDAEGRVTMEAYTVMHDRSGAPETAIATVRIGEARAWATSTDRDVAAALTEGEWVGRTVQRSATGDLSVA